MAKGISGLRRASSQPLHILMAVASLVLLIACANIANLLLARSTARARELAVRQALGAGRLRIVRQLLTESLVLALAGGAMGAASAPYLSRLLLRMVSAGHEFAPVDVSLNTQLLLFALGVTVSTAILFGTVPAVRATRLELTDALKDGRGASTGAARSPLAKALVISQVALALVLLVGSALFLRTLVNLYNVDSGFRKENVLLFSLDESSAGYKPDDSRLPGLHREVQERVSAMPGIVAASYSSWTFGEGSWNGKVFVQGFDNDKTIDVKHNIVGKDYFAVMGIPIVAGRGFVPEDPAASKIRGVIVSRQMAKTMFPAGSPIGRHYGLGNQKSDGQFVVIGVAGDVKFDSLDEPAEDHTIDYYPVDPGAQYFRDFEVRYSGDRDAIASGVQKTIHAIDRNLPVTRVETLDQRLADSLSGQRMMAQLCSFFGLLAVFLSSVGIYGLMSYLVARRTNEIGVRMALGARPAHVLGLVMREILVLVTAGVAIGIPATLEGERLVTSLLYGLEPTDPFSLLGAMVLLIALSTLAGYLPARRASRVEPATALRCE